MPLQMPPEQAYGSSHVLSQGIDELVCNDYLSPLPSPTRRRGRGRGDHQSQRLSIGQSTWTNTFIRTSPILPYRQNCRNHVGSSARCALGDRCLVNWSGRLL